MIKDEFKYSIPDDDHESEEAEYEKQLEKEIEIQCGFPQYVDKLELPNEISDEDLINNKTKEQIVEYKNSVIDTLYAYIASLEREKNDLINNFKETTNVLLEKIKDNEFHSKGVRPSTPMIAKQLKQKGGVTMEDFKSLQQNDINNINAFAVNNKNIDVDNNINKTQRCPNCKSEIPEDQFIAHSLSCLRKVMNCIKCGELVPNDKKKEHLAHYRNIDLINKAIQDKDKKFIILSIAHGFNTTKPLDKNGNKLIHLICINLDVDSVKEILSSSDKPLDLNILNNYEETPLSLCIINKKDDMCNLLLNKNADFNRRNKSDMSPLMLCCKHGNINIAKVLLNKGANVNEKNILGETPLKIAQLNRHDDLAMMLLTQYRANIKFSK